MMDSGDRFYRLKEDAIMLRVKAKPGSARDGILGVRGGELLASVRAVAEKGRANKELVRLLSEALGIRKDQVVLKTGAGTPHKVFEIPLSAMQALRRLEEKK
jgi:uncharacterized protein (TIGR00251 family)